MAMLAMLPPDSVSRPAHGVVVVGVTAVGVWRAEILQLWLHMEPSEFPQRSGKVPRDRMGSCQVAFTVLAANSSEVHLSEFPAGQQECQAGGQANTPYNKAWWPNTVTGAKKG